MPGFGEVEFVADEHDDDSGIGLALEFGDPGAGFCERGLQMDGLWARSGRRFSHNLQARRKGERGGTDGRGDVVDDDGGVCAPVVHRREALVPFLARRVPDLRPLGRSLPARSGLGSIHARNRRGRY